MRKFPGANFLMLVSRAAKPTIGVYRVKNVQKVFISTIMEKEWISELFLKFAPRRWVVNICARENFYYILCLVQPVCQYTVS